MDYLYCRYTFHFGNDWSIASGLDTGLSQTSCKNSSRPEDPIAWNFPVDITFKSTNVFGWPRIALSVYGIDFLGRDVIRGYGSVLIPLSAGQHQLEVEMYAPLATSALNQFASMIMGNPPEVSLRSIKMSYHTMSDGVYLSLLSHSPQFFDSKFVCQGEGREVSRVQSTGRVILNLNVVTKGTNILKRVYIYE